MNVWLWLKRAQLSRIYAASSSITSEQLKRRTLVISPHFDDETLGCGGLIIKKKRAGADVKILFMTDGGRSHQHLMPPEQLKTIRANEGVAAARTMGLDEDDVFRLGLDETRLNEHADEAIERINAILHDVEPEEVYLPYSREPLLWSSDHRMTTQIAYRALSTYKLPVIVYEYPIWSWYSLPWIDPMQDGWRTRIIIARNTLGTWLGLRLISDLRWTLDIRDVLSEKRSALEQHRSQMEPLIPDVGWATLEGVSGGQFLARFFEDREFFRSVRRYR